MTMISDTDTDTDRIARLEGAYGHLATKADLAQLGERVTQQIADSELRMTQNTADTEKRMVKQMADLEVRMTQMETRLTWRLIGAVGAMVAAVAIIERFLS